MKQFESRCRNGENNVPCHCLFAADDRASAMKQVEIECDSFDYEHNEVSEITTVTDKNGQKYRVMLVPDLSEEAKKDARL